MFEVRGELESERERRVKVLRTRVDPVQVKGLPLTADEREVLLGCIDALRSEIQNAPAYVGVFVAK